MESHNRIGNLVAPIVLGLALIHAHLGWHRDRSAYDELSGDLTKVLMERQFPADGEALANSPLRIIRETDTVSLAHQVNGREAVIYFERPSCFICSNLAAKLDSLLPTWRDSMVIVRMFENRLREPGELMLDSASSRYMTGVPSILVVDSAGHVRHSVDAGLPPVLRVLEFLGLPAPYEMLEERVAVDQAQSARPVEFSDKNEVGDSP